MTIDPSSPLLLIVEDNEFSRKITATALNGKRYVFAKNGQEAITAYEVNKPDIIFLDIELPDMNGFEVLREIRKRNSGAYVVMLSANSDKETVIRAIKSGARGFIVKPFSKAKLAEYIEKYLAESAFSRL